MQPCYALQFLPSVFRNFANQAYFQLAGRMLHQNGMPSKADLLQERAERFAVRVLKFIRTLPQTPEGDSLRRQLARSAPGISGNYRSARRGRSKAEFTSRLGVVVDEADETEQWLLMVKNSGLASGSELDWLIGESGELRAIYVASYGTARRNRN
jgi:four helix bundle protein